MNPKRNIAASLPAVTDPERLVDPLVRLRVDELRGLNQTHLHSQQENVAQSDSARSGVVFGFTEWASKNLRPALSFSWDWIYDAQAQRIDGQWDSLRTNLRIVDADGSGMGDDCTRLCVARLMTQVCWEHVIAESLGLRLTMLTAVEH